MATNFEEMIYMFEKYKDGDLITLKLMHGEEVISTLQSQTETTIEIKKAL